MLARVSTPRLATLFHQLRCQPNGKAESLLRTHSFAAMRNVGIIERTGGVGPATRTRQPSRRTARQDMADVCGVRESGT